jgi:hypothetical protein
MTEDTEQHKHRTSYGQELRHLQSLGTHPRNDGTEELINVLILVQKHVGKAGQG